jgi:hypothetical protein
MMEMQQVLIKIVKLSLEELDEVIEISQEFQETAEAKAKIMKKAVYDKKRADRLQATHVHGSFHQGDGAFFYGNSRDVQCTANSTVFF